MVRSAITRITKPVGQKDSGQAEKSTSKKSKDGKKSDKKDFAEQVREEAREFANARTNHELDRLFAYNSVFNSYMPGMNLAQANPTNFSTPSPSRSTELAASEIPRFSPDFSPQLRPQAMSPKMKSSYIPNFNDNEGLTIATAATSNNFLDNVINGTPQNSYSPQADGLGFSLHDIVQHGKMAVYGMQIAAQFGGTTLYDQIAQGAFNNFQPGKFGVERGGKNNLTFNLTRFSGDSQSIVNKASSKYAGIQGLDDNLLTVFFRHNTEVAALTDPTHKDYQYNQNLISLYNRSNRTHGANATWNLYRAELGKFLRPGDHQYVEAAEQIGNYSVAMADNVSAMALVSSTVNIVSRLRDPNKALTNTVGNHYMSIIADGKDHNNAFRDPAFAAMGADGLIGSSNPLTQKVGFFALYNGNGISDVQQVTRFNRLMREGTTLAQDANGRFILTNANDLNKPIGPMVSWTQQGHGNPGGNYGINGAFDKSDENLVQILAPLAYGPSLVCNLDACSNSRGSNSYADWLTNTFAKYTPNYMRIMTNGSSIDTPLLGHSVIKGTGNLHAYTHTSAPTLTVARGLQPVSPGLANELRQFYMNENGFLEHVNGRSGASQGGGFNLADAIFGGGGGQSRPLAGFGSYSSSDSYIPGISPQPSQAEETDFGGSYIPSMETTQTENNEEEIERVVEQEDYWQDEGATQLS